MKNLRNLLWGLGFAGIVSLGLTLEDKPQMNKTQIVANKDSEKEDYLSLLGISLLHAGGIGIYSSRYIKRSYLKNLNR